MKSGVYQIKNAVNGKIYVGSAVNLVRRTQEHKSRLRKGNHRNKHLQAAWDKYGESAFQFSLLLCCSKNDVLLFEQRAIDTLKPAYNKVAIAGSNIGMKHEQKTRERMKGAWTPERRANNAMLHRGKTLSNKTKSLISSQYNDERKQMLVERNKKPWTHDRRLAASLAHKGVVVGYETRQKQSQSQKLAWTEKRRESQSARMVSLNKKPWTEERREKLRMRNKGNKWHVKKRTEEPNIVSTCCPVK